MIPLLLFAETAAVAPSDLQPMREAVAKCDRDTMASLNKGEPHRRADFAGGVYAEQSAIAAERATLAQRPAPTAAAPAPSPAGKASLDTAAAALDARQKRLDDARLVEQTRRIAIDELRADFLANCDTRKRS